MRVRVLGALELVDGSPPGSVAGELVSVALRSSRLRRLLAALVVQPGAVVSADRLADVVWGDAPPENAGGALQSLVSRLRDKLRTESSGPVQAAGAPEIMLLTRAPGYLLRVDRDALDASRFEDLVRHARALLPGHPAQAVPILDEALALWHGPAFAEFADDDFARPEAARLEELRAAACEHRVEAALRLGQPEQALITLEPLLADHPLRERPQAQLLLALYRLGRQADALEAYRTYRRRLDEELGLDPSASLRRLEEQILRQDRELECSDPRRIDASEPGSSAPPAPAVTLPATPPVTEAADDDPARRNNLPATLPTLLGRGGEVAQVCALVRAGQLVTLTGPGGVGKTSLAQHAAALRSADFPAGAWLCELAAVSGPAAVPEALATAMAVPPRQGLSVTERLVEHLRSQRALLVLDNCEHVADGAAHLVEAVLRDCPSVSVLATSREPLRVERELVWPVSPLDVPPATADAAVIANSPAVLLFAERATAAAPDFAVTEANAGSVGEICRRLDGLPLAIELAATRMRSMTPGDLAGRLSWRFRVLRAGRRVAADRHRTLRAVVDWSYELLDAEQQRVFEALSVFAGSFTLEAAEAVAPSDLAPEDIAAVVAALADRSMVIARTDGSGARYALLETLRAYGREQLEACGEVKAAQRAHAEYIVAFTEGAAERLYGPDHGHWTAAISRQFDDLRAAHEWGLRHDLQLAARLVVALAVYVEERMSAETGQWAERTIDAAEASLWDRPPMAQVYAVAASAAIIAGDLERAAQRIDAGLAHAETGSPAHGHLGYVRAQLAGFEGRLEEAGRLCAEATEAIPDGPLRWIADQAAAGQVMYAAYSGDTEAAATLGERLWARTDRTADPTAMAWARYALAEALLDTEPGRARELLDQVLRLAHQVGERYLTGVTLVSMASSQARHGDPWQALPLYRDVIEHWRLAGSGMHQWTTIRNVVDLLVRLHEYESAAVLYGAVVSRTTGAPAFGTDAERLAEARRVLNHRLGAQTFAAAASRGRGMTDDGTTAFAGEVLARVAQAADTRGAQRT